jgi:hypothetical protein
MPDIYSRADDMMNYDPNLMEVADDLSIITLQIENILFTPSRSVIGVPAFGVDLESLLFNLTISANTIENIIMKQIAGNCPSVQSIPVSVQVKFFQGTTRDTAEVFIYINNSKTFSVLI